MITAHPNFFQVKSSEWETLLASHLVVIQKAEVWLVDTKGGYKLATSKDPLAFETTVYRVFPKVHLLPTDKTKVFYGDNAWQDAQRFAGRLDIEAYSIRG